MNNQLRRSLIEFFPDFKDILLVKNSISDSCWNAPLSTGKLLELVSLLFVCQSFKSFGANIIIPDLYRKKPTLFYLRNEMPLHHAAQAGHSASLVSEVELIDRFVAAFTPKVIINIGENSFYIMREGNPIHELEQAIKDGAEYDVRPDIGIYTGKISVSINENIVNVVSMNNVAEIHFSLEAKNTSIIPLIQYNENGEHFITTNGIIECSVNKSTRHANSQIDKYMEIFDNSSSVTVKALFINGGKGQSDYPTLNVNMDSLVDCFSSSDIDSKLSAFVKSII